MLLVTLGLAGAGRLPRLAQRLAGCRRPLVARHGVPRDGRRRARRVPPVVEAAGRLESGRSRSLRPRWARPAHGPGRSRCPHRAAHRPTRLARLADCDPSRGAVLRSRPLPADQRHLRTPLWRPRARRGGPALRQRPPHGGHDRTDRRRQVRGHLPRGLGARSDGDGRTVARLPREPVRGRGPHGAGHGEHRCGGRGRVEVGP